MMVNWTSGSPQLQDTFERLATHSLQTELESWDFVNRNLCPVNSWKIELDKLYKFQINLLGQQGYEFQRVVGDIIMQKALELGYSIRSASQDELILEKL
jgi:hypothetical protein